MQFERKIKRIPPENIEKITQFYGSGTAIIGHQSIRASKMAIEGLKKYHLQFFLAKITLCVKATSL